MVSHGPTFFAGFLWLMVALSALPGVLGQNCPTGLVPSPTPLLAICNINTGVGVCTQLDSNPLNVIVGAAEVLVTDGEVCAFEIDAFTTVTAVSDGTFCVATLTNCSAPTPTTTTTTQATTPGDDDDDDDDDDSSDSR